MEKIMIPPLDSNAAEVIKNNWAKMDKPLHSLGKLEEMVEKYEHRIINIHPSLIPSFCGVGYYGLHVHEKALERGVKVTGATVHFVNEGMDEGPIIAQKAVAVEDDDTPEILQRRVMEQAEWLLLPQAVDDIANGRICVVDGKVKHNK